MRRPEEARIADLLKQIEVLKQRKARKLVQRDPALKHMHAAVRYIDKALSSPGEPAIRAALGEARSTLSACLALSSKATIVPQPSRRVVGRVLSEEALLSHVRLHPGQRGEEIAKELGADTDTVRPVMKRLIGAGKVKTSGQARAMRYAVV